MKLMPQSDRPAGIDLAASVGLLAHSLRDELSAEDIPDPRQRALVERTLAAAAAAEERLAEQSRRIAFLEGLSRTDELTGLLNRRGFLEELRRAVARARRNGETGVVIYADIDRFKEINDEYGHASGDEVLREVARVLGQSVREVDSVSRLGGDEFAVLLSQTSWRNGLKRSRALQRELDRIACTFESEAVRVHVSLGAEPYGAHDEPDDLLVRADMHMYCNKRRRAGAELRAAAE